MMVYISLGVAILCGLIASIDADLKWLFRRRVNKLSVDELARLQRILEGGA